MDSAKWVVIVTVGLACGCATMQQMSAGQVGCPPEEISISDEQSGLGTSSWTAECRGERFYCSSVQSNAFQPQYGSLQVSCRPETKRAPYAHKAPEAPPAQSGCSYDTQCKGERICVNGRCVDPGASRPTAAASQPLPPAPAADDTPTGPINPTPPAPSSRKPLGKSDTP